MKIVVLDAGHGATTPGKRSFDSRLMEYEFNRAIASRMKPILEKMGYKVVLTAPTNADVSLNKRCDIANKEQADIFVSIHANASGKTWNDANGWEVIICELNGNSEALAKCFEDESEVLGLRNRGIKVNENLVVLNGTRMPAILVEHGFFTNKEECKKLLSGKFRKAAAEANCNAIDKYFKEKEGK